MDVWVLTGESGLNGHWVEAVFDHEPTDEELDKIDREKFPRSTISYETADGVSEYEVSNGTPTGWGCWLVTKMEVKNY